MALTSVGKPVDRWLAFGRLHEDFGAPLDLIADAAELTLAYVQRIARQRNWKTTTGLTKLHMRLANAFDLHLKLMSEPGFDEIAAEKRSRVLSSTAKSLEILRSMNVDPTAKYEAKQGDQKSIAEDTIIDDAVRIEYVAQQLEKFLETDDQTGKTK